MFRGKKERDGFGKLKGKKNRQNLEQKRSQGQAVKLEIGTEAGSPIFPPLNSSALS